MRDPVEAMAREACERNGGDPDAWVSPRDGTRGGVQKWRWFIADAECYLALARRLVEQAVPADTRRESALSHEELLRREGYEEARRDCLAALTPKEPKL